MAIAYDSLGGSIPINKIVETENAKTDITTVSYHPE
jgi:hypothetical protein